MRPFWKDAAITLIVMSCIGIALYLVVDWLTHAAPRDTSPIHVAFCERVWSGPKPDDYSLVMVWSDGEIWAAPTSHLKSWSRITTVHHDQEK